MTRIFVEDSDLQKHDRELLLEFLQWYESKRNEGTRKYIVTLFYDDKEKSKKMNEIIKCLIFAIIAAVILAIVHVFFNKIGLPWYY